MRHSSQSAARFDLTTKLRSRLFRSEFFRLFPEKSPDQADRPPRPPMCWSELLSHPLAVRAAQALVGGKPAEEHSLAATVGAHLASGPVGWRMIGLDRDEVKELFYAYVHLLNASNVKDVNAHLQIVEVFVVVDPRNAAKAGGTVPAQSALTFAALGGPKQQTHRIIASLRRHAK